MSRLRPSAPDPLLRSAYSLMINVAVTTGLGLAFWVAAARLYDAHTVGRDAALIAAMMELSTICQLNLVNALVRFLPSLERGTARALAGAYALSGMAALIVGGAFVVLAPRASDQFEFLRKDLAIAIVYVLAQILWTWFMLEDAALTALRKAHWVPVENGVFAALKLVALPLLLALGAANGVFVASVAPIVLLVIPVNLFLFLRAIPEHVRARRANDSLLHRLDRRRLVGFLAQDYGGTVFSQACSTALPVLVVALLGSSANAYFYIPYTIVVAFTMLFYGACTSLVVEGGLAEHRVQALSKKVVKRVTLLLVPAAIVLIAAAPLILMPFGADYVREGAPVLRILAIGALFRGATILYIALARLHGNGARILAAEGAQAFLLLTGVVLLAKPLGLQGVAAAWVAATGIVAAVVSPSLVRFFRAPTPTIVAEEEVRHPAPKELAVP